MAETATGAGVMTVRERVRELLEANDGRIRQTAIADEFDWSASKTSRVIENMVEDGTLRDSSWAERISSTSKTPLIEIGRI